MNDELRQSLEIALSQPESQIETLISLSKAAEATVIDRLQRLRHVQPALQTLCRSIGWTEVPLDLAWQLWLPLAIELMQERDRIRRPIVQGILGGQGTGKTTLALMVSRILQQFGLSVARLSIDDLYKTYRDRQILQQQDPRLRWRGPPGTHDVELGLEAIERLRRGESAGLPRFDKSLHQGAGDRIDPEWVERADVILFEGWFVGARPIDPQAFEDAPWPIETESDRAFARDCNDRLHAYLPLWNLLDALIVLAPIDFRLSLTWRQQAEQQMKAQGKAGMSAAEIKEFVLYFWRSLHPQLFIAPLMAKANWAIALNANHQIETISRARSSLLRDE
ncbi:glycerate kinase [Microcoleus sp. FACHB-1515]|uniref:glycerate kinase n=1 Tax=Cyanophyceae TaxID=3028117 RepID=UPI0016874B68|nr:glycerate kinase [Microcoleus sp. FACHB-1515]MBD2090815.1 glycerate kinase [Microcoleus sp. FACHB-1515]